MQDFRDDEKKLFKMTVSRQILDFYFSEICHGLFLCESLHFVLYAWSSCFALFLSCKNIEKLKIHSNSKWPLDRHFKIVCSQS